jgi:hypothetical protein
VFPTENLGDDLNASNSMVESLIHGNSRERSSVYESE